MQNYFQNKKRRRLSKSSLATIVGVILVILITLVVVGIILFLKRDDYKEDENGVQDQTDTANIWLDQISGASEEKKLALVGKEFIFESDLDVQKNKLPISGYTSDSQYIEKLIDDSILLQEGEKQGWITLKKSFFNNPYKSYVERSEMLAKVRENANLYSYDGIIYEGIVLMFVNVKGTDIVEEKGREYVRILAFNKISDIYEKVKNGVVTIQEGADILESDIEVKALYHNGEAECYLEPVLVTFDDLNNEISTDSVEKRGQLKNTSSGNYTDVLLLQREELQNSEGNDLYWDGSYAFYHVLARNENGISSLNDWIEEIKNKYYIKYFEN